LYSIFDLKIFRLSNNQGFFQKNGVFPSLFALKMAFIKGLKKEIYIFSTILAYKNPHRKSRKYHIF